MVQIIPENKRSFMTAILGGLGQGVESGFEQYGKAKENKRSAEAAQRLTGKDLSGLDPETRQKVVVELLQQSGKMTDRQRLGEIISRGYSGEQQTSSPQKLGMALADERPSQVSVAEQQSSEDLPRRRFSDQQIAEIAVENPAVAREIRAAEDAAAKERREVITAKEKKQEAIRAETVPLKKEISDRAQAARDSIRNKEGQMDIIKRGDLDDPTYAAVLESLPFNYGKRFLSKDTVEYKAGLVDEFKDLRQIFSGATRVKEIDILEGKIADIYLTDEQKMAILGSRIDAAKVDLIREQAALQLEEEGKNYSYLQYRNELEKRAKPKIDALFNRVLDQQQAVMKDAENMKKIPLRFDDPETHTILSQIMKEAKGVKSVAREIAKKKGYTIGEY